MELKQLSEKESEANYPPDERRHAEISSSASYRGYLSASVDYGKLLVANLIVINAGALLIFPTLLDKVKSGSLDVNTVTGAATMFVLGIFSALASGFVAYLNFMWLAKHETVFGNRRSFFWKCNPEMLDLKENQTIIAGFDADLARLERRINVTLYLSIIMGILAFAFFVSGCGYVRSDVLSRHDNAIVELLRHLFTIWR